MNPVIASVLVLIVVVALVAAFVAGNQCRLLDRQAITLAADLMSDTEVRAADACDSADDDDDDDASEDGAGAARPPSHPLATPLVATGFAMHAQRAATQPAQVLVLQPAPALPGRPQYVVRGGARYARPPGGGAASVAGAAPSQRTHGGAPGAAFSPLANFTLASAAVLAGSRAANLAQRAFADVPDLRDPRRAAMARPGAAGRGRSLPRLAPPARAAGAGAGGVAHTRFEPVVAAPAGTGASFDREAAALRLGAINAAPARGWTGGGGGGGGPA